jgi:AcrR family transcriptional regulator
MARTISDEEILNAALDVITEHGYTAATTRRISAAAGINEVTLFRRFGSKKNLLITAIEQEVENFIAAGLEYTGDLEADLLRIVHFYHNLLKNRGRMISMLLTEVPRQPELLEVMQVPLTIIVKIKAILERYQDEGVLVKEPPMQALVSLTGPLFMKEIIKFMQPSYSEALFDAAEYVRLYLKGRTA